MKITLPVFVTISLLLPFFSCNSPTPDNHELIVNEHDSTFVDSLFLDEGVYIEYFDSSNNDPLRQTYDNTIYTLNRAFRYKYVFKDTTGKEGYYHCATFKRRYWELISKEEMDTAQDGVQTLTLTTILNDKEPHLMNQSFIEWAFYNAKGDKVTLEQWATAITHNENTPPTKMGTIIATPK